MLGRGAGDPDGACFEVVLGGRAERTQHLAESAHIGDVGHALNDRDFVRQERSCQALHRRILRAGDLHFAAQRASADDAQRNVIRLRGHCRTSF